MIRDKSNIFRLIDVSTEKRTENVAIFRPFAVDTSINRKNITFIS